MAVSVRCQAHAYHRATQALEEAKRTLQLVSEYRAAAYLQRHGGGAAGATTTEAEAEVARARLRAARERLRGPPELLDALGLPLAPGFGRPVGGGD